MKKKFIKLMLLSVMIMIPINIKAVTFEITKSADNLKPGNTSTVTIKATGINNTDEMLGGYNLNLTYDTSKLEFAGGVESAKSDVSASGNTVNIKSKTDVSGSGESFEVAKFNFKVLGNITTGNAKLELSGVCTILDHSDKKCTYNSTQISVSPLGTDSTLSALEIPNTTLSPSFSKNVLDYKATIQDITSLSVNATPTDKNASFKISDNAKSLQKGDNDVKVTVTSEDGQSTTTYSIKVNLKLTPTDEELLKANALLKTLAIKEQSIEFDQNEKKYYITVPYKTKYLTITAKPVNEKATVKIEGNKKILVGKNTVKVTVTSEDKTKIENYQIIVTREDQKKEIVQTCPDETSSREWILFTASMLITFTLGIILGYYLCKKDVLKKLFSKKEKKVEKASEIETLSDTIDLSKTVKEVKKKNK